MSSMINYIADAIEQHPNVLSVHIESSGKICAPLNTGGILIVDVDFDLSDIEDYD